MAKLLLYHPWAALWWCIVHRRVPSLWNIACCLQVAVLYPLVGWYIHVLIQIDDGYFHTRLGRIRCDSNYDFHAGYLETCKRIPIECPPLLVQRFMCKAGRPNRDPTTILLTPLFRFLYARGLILRDARTYSSTNCTEFIARTFLEEGIDLCPARCLQGIYPSDFYLRPAPSRTL